MKKTIAVIITASTLFLAGCCTTYHATVWEYRTTPDISAVNQLASQGWRVVAYSQDSTGNKTFVLERGKR